MSDPRLAAIPDVHGHAKGEHKPFAEERPIAYSARMLFLWFYHACNRGAPRFMMVSDHINYLTFEDPGAVSTVRRALKLAEAGDLYGAAETAGVDLAHAAVVSEGLRRGMKFSIGAEIDNDPRARPDAQNIVDAMRPDGMIRSVHFLTIEHPEKGADWQWPFDNPEFKDLFSVVGLDRTWELYMAKLLDDIEKLPGHIVGHFYVPVTLGHWPTVKKLEEYESRLIAAVAARGMAIELNTRFLYRDNPEELKKKYRDANLRLIKKARAKGVGVAIGADAHSPKDQAAAFDVALKLLDEAKINEVVFPIGGRLARVALRATREHLEKVRAREPAPLPGSSISGLSRAEMGLPELAERERGRGRKTARAVGSKRAPARAPKRAAKKSSASRLRSKPVKKTKAVTKKLKPKPKAKKPIRKVKKPAAKRAAPKKAAAKKGTPKKKVTVKSRKRR